MPHLPGMAQAIGKVAPLPGRRVVRVSGGDRVGFLQGLVSNDVALAGPGRAVWAALLSPQGKYLADFFVVAAGEFLLLEVDGTQAALVAQRLARFRLRADVAVAETDLRVWAGWDGAPRPAEMPDGPVVFDDPRLPEAGWRAIGAGGPEGNAALGAYEAHRIALGLPDGARDLEPEKSVLLEAGFDELHGVSWTKGCYMGQELTARTRYRGLVKRRLLGVEAASLPAPGTPVMAGEREVGTLRSVAGGRGLALLRLEAIAEPLEAAGVALNVVVFPWMRLPGDGQG